MTNEQLRIELAKSRIKLLEIEIKEAEAEIAKNAEFKAMETVNMADTSPGRVRVAPCFGGGHVYVELGPECFSNPTELCFSRIVKREASERLFESLAAALQRSDK
jgi:hypothetical protein